MAEELTHEQIKKVQALYPKIAPELNEINGLKDFIRYFIFYYIVKQLEKQGFVSDEKFTNIEYPNDEELLTVVFHKQ